jgi:hypothetical protein
MCVRAFWLYLQVFGGLRGVAALPQPMAGALGGVGSVAAIGPGLRASITAPFASGDLRSMSLMNTSLGAGAKSRSMSELGMSAQASRPYSPGAPWSTGLKASAPLTGSLGRERGSQTREAMDSFLLDFMKGASVL